MVRVYGESVWCECVWLVCVERDGAHWGHVQLNVGPKPITQAVVASYQ